MRSALFCVIMAVMIATAFACLGEPNYNPNTVTIGQCGANTVANYQYQDKAPVLTPADLSAADLALHESRMEYILTIARAQNKKFVSSIYFPNGTLACIGVNTGKPNLISHGEIVAINNCSELYGTTNFQDHTLYTTGEPCSMCASAILWARFKKVIWGTYNSDLYCKICMSNIPIDSSYIFARAYALGVVAPIAIGGVLRAEADAWFGTYCNRPTSIYYIAPQCACQSPIVSPLNITQTQVTSWIDGAQIQWSQYNAVITNTGNSTVNYPNFLSTPAGVVPQQIWGLSATGQPNEYKLSWNPTIPAGQSFSFGYILQGGSPLTFTHEI